MALDLRRAGGNHGVHNASQEVTMHAAIDLRVRDLMTVDPVVVGPDASAAEAERLLKTNRVSGLPVVDDGATVGVVSLTDMMVARSSAMIHANWPRMRVRHLMSTPAITVHAGNEFRARGRADGEPPHPSRRGGRRRGRADRRAQFAGPPPPPGQGPGGGDRTRLRWRRLAGCHLSAGDLHSSLSGSSRARARTCPAQSGRMARFCGPTGRRDDPRRSPS